MKSAKVAVITRTKNRTALLKRALKSVFSQTFDDFILVVVNDGGEQAEVDHLLSAELSKPQLEKTIIIHNKESLGMEAAANLGVESCESEYIVIHDDDDSWQPEFLSATAGWLDRNIQNADDPEIQYGGVLARITEITETFDGQKATEVSRRKHNDFLATIPLFMIARTNVFLPIGFVFLRSIWLEIGKFNSALPVVGDWDFNLRLLSKYNIHMLDDFLANYHVRANSDGVYANSIAGGLHHQKIDNLVRNRLMQQQLKLEPTMIGLFVNMVAAINDPHNAVISRLDFMQGSLHHTIQQQQTDIRLLNEKIQAIYLSRSWTIGRFVTLPFRAVRSIFRRILK